MRHYTKEQAISIVTTCAKEYRKNLADRVAMLVAMVPMLAVNADEPTGTVYEVTAAVSITALIADTTKNAVGITPAAYHEAFKKVPCNNTVGSPR